MIPGNCRTSSYPLNIAAVFTLITSIIVPTKKKINDSVAKTIQEVILCSIVFTKTFQ